MSVDKPSRERKKPSVKTCCTVSRCVVVEHLKPYVKYRRPKPPPPPPLSPSSYPSLVSNVAEDGRPSMEMEEERLEGGQSVAPALSWAVSVPLCSPLAQKGIISRVPAKGSASQNGPRISRASTVSPIFWRQGPEGDVSHAPAARRLYLALPVDSPHQPTNIISPPLRPPAPDLRPRPPASLLPACCDLPLALFLASNLLFSPRNPSTLFQHVGRGRHG